MKIDDKSYDKCPPIAANNAMAAQSSLPWCLSPRMLLILLTIAAATTRCCVVAFASNPHPHLLNHNHHHYAPSPTQQTSHINIATATRSSIANQRRRLASPTSSTQISLSVRSLAREAVPSSVKGLDANRIASMLSAMDSYTVVASLLMGSGLYLFAITPMKIKDYDFTTTSSDNSNTSARASWVSKVEKAAMQMFAVISAISITTSLRTIIIMKIMTLYANTALGQTCGDEVFFNFWYSPLCTKLRASSFTSFLTAIQTFRGAFAFLKTDGKHRYVATGVTLLIMIISGVQLDQMVKLASVTIFHQ